VQRRWLRPRRFLGRFLPKLGGPCGRLFLVRARKRFFLKKEAKTFASLGLVLSGF
jgi:hypothetical protein